MNETFTRHPHGLGDLVEVVAKPIAKALGLSCLNADGTLNPDSFCAKRRDRLNGKTPLRLNPQSPQNPQAN